MVVNELTNKDKQPPSYIGNSDDEVLLPRAVSGVTIELLYDGQLAGTLGVIRFPYKFNKK
jgi:hypothetical protein